MQIFNQQNFLTTKWNGGKTTQLYIFPENGNFKTGEYDFRISTASVEINESTFTLLSNTNRNLMVLKGELKLSHQGKEFSKLFPFDSEKFKGHWNTTSIGKSVNLNVISKHTIQSNYNIVQLKSSECFELNTNDFHHFIYLVEGELNIKEAQKSITIQQGELCKLTPKQLIGINASSPSVFVCIEIIQS